MRSSGSKILGLIAIITIFFPLAGGATTAPLLPDSGQGSFAGTSVAIFGDLAAVGAPDADEAGAVYLYQKSGGQWSLLTGAPIRQPISDQNGGDDFGESVALAGDGTTSFLLVGAPGDDGAGQTAGAGYVFTISGGTVSSPQKLSISGASNRALGTSVGIFWNSISPNQSIAVLGAPLDSVSTQGTNSGSIAVFGYNGASWFSLNSRVFPGDGNDFDRFGESVSVGENFVIVGAANARSASNSDGGEAYIIPRGNWTFMTKLSGLLPAENSLSVSDLFGESVSIDGDFAIVGASGYDNGGLSNSGAAFVFSRDPSTGIWSFGDPLIPADNESLDRFGRAVSLSGNFAVIGAPEEGTYGAAYVYENSNGSWIPFLWDHDQDTATPDVPKKLPTSAASELTENAKYGASVSVYDDPSGVPSVIVGAPENGFLSPNGGTAQVDGDVSSNQPQNVAPVLRGFTNVFSTELVEFSQPFQAYDFDLDSLTVTASSSDAFVVSPQNVFLDGASLGSGLTLAVDGNGSLQGILSVTPSSRGEATITIEVSDGQATAVGSFQITITFPPEILDENGANIENLTVSFSSPEDQPGNIPFQIADGDGDTLTVSAVSSNDAIIPSASLQINNQGSTADIPTVAGVNSNVDLAFQPVLDAVGSATLTVTVTDGSATVETAFAVTITDVNDPPFFADLGTVSVEEDSGPSTVTFTVEDVDSPSGSISVNVIGVDKPDLFSNELTPTGSGNTWSLDFTPAVDASGTANVTLEASDGFDSDTGVLTINVTEDGVVLRELPVGLEVSEDNSATDSFILRHTNSLSTTVTVESNNGTLLPNTDTNIKLNGATRVLTVSSFIGNEATLNLLLDPEPNQSGVADITITATDSNGNTDRGSFTFTVTDVNDPPVLSGVPETLQTINEDNTFGPITITISDPDDPISSLTIDGTSSIGALVPDGAIEILPESGSAESNRTLRIRPLLNQNSVIHGGPTRITITVSDGLLEDSTSFDLQVDAVNDDPVFIPSTLPNVTDLTEDDPSRTLSYSVQDVDLEGLVLTVAPASNEALFESVHFGSDPNTGPNQTFLPASSDPIPFDITLNLAADQFGSDFIEVTATDGGGDTVKSFYVSVASDNDPPEITGEAPAQGSPGELYTFTVAVSDVETLAEDLTVTVEDRPSWAQFDRASLTFSGTPTNDDIGTYSVRIQVADEENDSASKVFNFSIVREEFAPEIDSLGQTAYSVLENQTISIPFEVSDANADTLLVTAALQNTDPALLTDSGVSISGLAPDETIQVGFDSPSGLSLEVSPEQYANSVKYGTANVVVTVNDQMGSPVVTQTFTVTVDAVATQPIILLDDPDPDVTDVPLNNQNFETSEGTVLEVPFSVTELDWGTLTISANSTNTDVIPIENIDIRGRGQSLGLGSTYILNVNSNDPHLLTIALEPGEFASGTTAIELTFNLVGLDNSTRTNVVRIAVIVNPVNDAPEVTADTAPWSMQEGTTAGFQFNVSDPEGDDLLLEISTSDDGILPANQSHIRINGVGYQSGGFPLTETVYSNPIQIELTPAPFANTFGINPVEITFLVTETGTDPALASEPLVVKLEVTPVNDPPALEPIFSQSIVEDAEESTVTPIPLTVSDPDGDELEFTFTSENTDLILNEEIHLYVNGNRRFPAVLTSADYDIADPQVALRIVPIGNANSDLKGTAFINVTVTDPANQSVTQRFRLTVTPVPDVPVVDYNDGPWVISEEGRIDTSFTVFDPDGDSLLVTVASDQPDVVPNNKNNLIMSGAAGTNLTGDSWVQANVQTTSGQVSTVNLAILPLEDQFTSTPLTITLTASDGTLDATPATFSVTVENVNDLPVVTGFFDPSTMVFGNTKVIPFSVSDADPGDLALIKGASGTDGISKQSANTELVNNSNITVSQDPDGGEGDFLLSIVANANAEIGDPFSSSQITVVVSDQKQATQIQFVLQVFPDTTLIPEISYSFDPLQFIEEDTTTMLPIEILYEGSATDFELFGVSDNEDLIPSGNISFFPRPVTEPNVFPYDVQLVPAKDAFSSNIDSDTANITILANANGFFARTDFEVAVLGKNDTPEITLLFDPAIDANTFANAPKILEFLVSDPETAANDLVVNVSYSPLSTTLGGIEDAAVDCTDGNCQLTITPISATAGELTANILLSVDDGSGIVPNTSPNASVKERDFSFTVLPNDRPSISFSQNSGRTSADTIIDVEFTVRDNNGGDLQLEFIADPVFPIRNFIVTNIDGDIILTGLDVPTIFSFTGAETTETLIMTIEPEPGVLADTRITGTVQDTSLAQGQDIFDLRIFTPGDIDADGDADLADVISGLQILVGLQPASVDLRADVNGDDRLGLPEVIYDLQVVAEIR